MKVPNNKERQFFYIDFKKELNSDGVEQARFLFSPYGIILDFQTRVWVWNYIAEIIPGRGVRCAIRDLAQHRLNALFGLLKENEKEEAEQ
jgi:hypothetical protein